ncbi:MAG: hypothetical protein OXF56_10855 [Rhodobacteraceae bacterium]|nr:hypothetical protein [Paracoccaceae bacterium]
MANMKIASTATDGLEPLGNPGQRSYDLLKGILLEKLSERHADLLAEPVTSQDGRWTDWYSDGSATKLVDLDESDQDAARAELGRLKSDIEELAGRMSARGDSDNLRLSAALSNILEVPDEASVYVRRVDSPDGCPFQLVLTNWSHRKADQPKAVSVLSTMVPRQPRAAPPAPPVAPPVAVPAVRTAFPWWVFWWLGWLVLGIAIAYLLWLLVLPCGVRLPFGGTLHLCPAAIAEVDRGAAARQDQLEGEIARLELDLATLEGQCQAQPVVPEPPREIVETPPDEPEIQGLDARRWAAQDLRMLDGCWILEPTRNIRTINGEVINFDDWTMCFDENGNGDLRFWRDGGLGREREQCKSGATAMFDSDGQLVISSSGKIRCDGGGGYYRRAMTCIEDGRGSADCDIVAPDYTAHTQGRFKMSKR